jgi:hypothetical protein
LKKKEYKKAKAEKIVQKRKSLKKKSAKKFYILHIYKTNQTPERGGER